MPRDVTMKQLRIVTAVCAFSIFIAQVNAGDRFLVDEGKAYAEIIISEAPARLAAAETQTTLRRSPAGGFQSKPRRKTARFSSSTTTSVTRSTAPASLSLTRSAFTMS